MKFEWYIRIALSVLGSIFGSEFFIKEPSILWFIVVICGILGLFICWFDLSNVREIHRINQTLAESNMNITKEEYESLQHRNY
jgi:hypothetical protein